MSQYQFLKLLKQRIKENALTYLTGKQKSKGSEIRYSDIEMADYLLPVNSELTIEQKQKMFLVRNKMIEISENFPGKEIDDKCYCGKDESMSHIYYCEKLNNNEPQQLKYEEIFEGKLNNQITIFKKFEQNLEKREMLMEEEKMDLNPHVIL